MNLTVTHCNPSTLEAEAGGLGVRGWLGLHETLKKQWKGFVLIIKRGPYQVLLITPLYLGRWGKKTAHLKPAWATEKHCLKKKKCFLILKIFWAICFSHWRPISQCLIPLTTWQNHLYLSPVDCWIIKNMLESQTCPPKDDHINIKGMKIHLKHQPFTRPSEYQCGIASHHESWMFCFSHFHSRLCLDHPVFIVFKWSLNQRNKPTCPFISFNQKFREKHTGKVPLHHTVLKLFLPGVGWEEWAARSMLWGICTPCEDILLQFV